MSASPSPVTAFSNEDVTRIVRERWNRAAGVATWIGAGAWSDCFAFSFDGRRYAIRVGAHGEDFAKDHVAGRFAAQHLPIPPCGPVGQLEDGFSFVVSSYVPGTALERTEFWPAIVPRFVALLERLRLTPLEDCTGWGPWDPELSAPHNTWSAYLLDVGVDRPGRIHGWRTKLATNTAASTAFEIGLERLRSVAIDDVPHSLVHFDLLHANVHVHDGEIAGVFDWGNSILGDHLYDVALLCFWQPWLVGTDPDRVIAQLRDIWRATGYQCHNFDRRLQACLLHVGLGHIAYHASVQDWVQAGEVASRMDAVCARSW